MKNVLAFTFLLSSLLFFACQHQAESELNAWSKIDHLILQKHQTDSFHGGIVISHKGEVKYEKYFGLADRTWNIPMDKEVKFDIASVNKSMIAALIMRAVEQEKLQLNDTLVKLLSAYHYRGSFHTAITLHHLLSHTSGLPDYDAVSEELQTDNFLRFKRKHFSNAEYVDFISQLKPIDEPNKQFYYSNFAYHLLAIILEDTYQMSFAEILKEELSQPLGLKHTLSASQNSTIIKQLAKGYQFDEESKQWRENPFIDLSLGRRIFSTPADLNRWALAIDNPGYLSKQSLELIKQNHLAEISKTVSYGYGWVSVNEKYQSQMGKLNTSLPYLIHGGSTDGYKSMLINLNSGEYVVSFLSNVGDRTQELVLANKIVNLLPLEK